MQSMLYAERNIFGDFYGKRLLAILSLRAIKRYAQRFSAVIYSHCAHSVCIQLTFHFFANKYYSHSRLHFDSWLFTIVDASINKQLD